MHRRTAVPYAKTSGGGNWRLLEGYRHEFGSLLAAERTDLPDCTRDLILHLIAAHHGNARPLISSEGCEDGPPSLLESRAGEAALRFARPAEAVRSLGPCLAGVDSQGGGPERVPRVVRTIRKARGWLIPPSRSIC